MKLMMQGRLTECYLLSFRLPEQQVRPLLPPGLSLVTRGSWAFWNVVICRVEKMRPLALPRSAGLSYHHVAYRLMVECKLANRAKLQGLYFVRSDADDALIAGMGNCVTDFHFHQSGIRFETTEERFCASVVTGDGLADLVVAADPNARPMPGTTLFETEEERKLFLKYRPVGLAPNKEATKVHLAEVMREEADWVETDVAITQFESQFLRNYDLTLEQATRVAPLEYRWKLGRKMDLFHNVPAKRLSRPMEEALGL